MRIRGLRRLKLLLKSLFKCEICGETGKVLIIHHKDFNPKNDDPNNLMIVCPTCHFKEHLKGKRKMESGK